MVGAWTCAAEGSDDPQLLGLLAEVLQPIVAPLKLTTEVTTKDVKSSHEALKLTAGV